jgi:hypothetical protein
MTTSDKGHGSVCNAGSRREHGMVEKAAQRGARHHCTTTRSTETDGRKARETFQRMQNDRERSPRSSRQRVGKTSLVGARLCTR